MEWINAVLGNISDFMYTYILIIMLVLVGLYFSFRTSLYNSACSQKRSVSFLKRKRMGKIFLRSRR